MNRPYTPFKTVYWDDVRELVKKTNPDLVKIIDRISPDKRYPLIMASYHFGDLILKDGRLQLPTTHGIHPLSDARIDKKTRDSLSYASIPLGYLLNKSSEIFIHGGDRIIPLNFFEPGKIFGTFETVDAICGISDSPMWNLSAGARSIFTLPKITKASGFKRLRMSFDIPSSMNLGSLQDHWEVFRHIADQQRENKFWQSDVLFFTDAWFKESKDPAWVDFSSYIFKQAWLQAKSSIARFSFGIFWQNFVKAITRRNIQPSTYLSDTIKHLLAIATGAAPAFTPADNSELAAPTTFLQDAIVYVYQLDHYLPTIMHPSLLENTHSQLYYSLNMPTILEGTPEGKKTLTIMLDLKDIKLMIETLAREMATNDQSLIKDINFSYFHADEDKHGEIGSSKKIIDTDTRFSKQNSIYPNREFCWTSPFWQGCIQISKNS